MLAKVFSIISVIVFGVMIRAQSAIACAVCFSGQGKSLEAYYWITVILSVLPVALFATIYYWIKRNQHHFEDQK